MMLVTSRCPHPEDRPHRRWDSAEKEQMNTALQHSRPRHAHRSAAPLGAGRRRMSSRRGGRGAPARDRGARVLMVTEGTYPYAVGGVSSWCEVLIGGLKEMQWQILPVIAGGKRMRQRFELPSNARLLSPIELWSEKSPPRRMPRFEGRRRRAASDPAAQGADAVERAISPTSPRRSFAVVSFRRSSGPSFAPGTAGRSSCGRSVTSLGERHDDSAPAPVFDAIEAARLYQTLYWVARTAAVPTPPCDLLHVTAAGWAAIPAIVHKALHGTPLLLTEHGVYVREAYLASVREAAMTPGQGHISPRLALGLTRATYATADVISPVTEANAAWERGLGVDPAKIRVIPNGIHPPDRAHRPSERAQGDRDGADRPAQGRPDDDAGGSRGDPPDARRAV